MRILKAPTVTRGEPLRADTWNQLAAAVNGELLAPRDLDGGEEGQRERIQIPETERTSEEVRIENPDDSEQYVNVDRARVSILVNKETRDEYEIKWLNVS